MIKSRPRCIIKFQTVYDLLLLDIKMPKMNRFELYDNLRKIDDKAKVCFITAFEVYYKSLKELFPNLT
jgi:two-component SAPR family response regulator